MDQPISVGQVADFDFFKAPPDYVAIASIAGAAGAIGNACVIEGKRGWREPAVLWGMLIGPPSAHKTPAMKAAHGALAAIDHELYVEWKKDCEQIEVQHQIAVDAQVEAKKSKKTLKKPEKPPLKHLLHDETSLTRSLRLLVDARWVAVRTGDDRREKWLTITPAGRAHLRRLDRLLAGVQDELLAPLSPGERAQLVRLLTRLLEHHSAVR